MGVENQPVLQNASFWQRHVDQFKQCRQSKLSYCNQHKLIYHRFIYWFDKLTSADEKTSPVSSLIQLKLRDKGDENNVIASLVLRNGVQVNIHQEAVLFNLIKQLS